MFKVINFFSGSVLSTHDTVQAADEWIKARGYVHTFANCYLLEDEKQEHKPPILRIIETQETVKNESK